MQTIKEIDFSTLAKNEQNARLKLRFLALAHFKDGKSRHQIAKYIKVSRTSVNKWISDFLIHGLEGLNEPTRIGRPHKLTTRQLEKLSVFINEQSIKKDGGRLQGSDIHEYIKTHFNVDYKQSNIYRILHQQGFSWITSRSKHPKQNEEAQEAFKKNANQNDQLDPWSYAI